MWVMESLVPTAKHCKKAEWHSIFSINLKLTTLLLHRSKKIPHKIVIAFVSSQRYNGNYSLNPFKFNHYNVNTMSVLVNDVCMPHRSLEMNFQKGQFTSALCNVLREHPNVIINANSLDNGYSLFVFNVNSSHDEDDLALQNSGNVRLEVQFAKELPESVQLTSKTTGANVRKTLIEKEVALILMIIKSILPKIKSVV